MFTQEDLKKIRDYSFEVHCHQVKIFQKQGIELSGHGTIKINTHGIFYMDFICLEKKQISNRDWSVTYPIDNLNQSQKLYLDAISIRGIVFESDEFSINLHALQLDEISQHYIFFNKIQTKKSCTSKSVMLYIESNQQLDIPKNKINKTTSTLGNSSSSWNEALIDIPDENLSVRIVSENKDYSFIEVVGDIDKDKDKILDSLILYIGFCSGALLQPYFSVYTTYNFQITTLYSITKSYLHRRFSPAILSNYAESQKIQCEYHFDVLRSCIKLHAENTQCFLSIYAQWKRVWLSFHSVQDITNLTLVTAIEGLLNDVFIPVFKQSKIDNTLEQDIKNIKKVIKYLDIDDSYKERLQNSISYLKDITATKALNFLSDDGILKNEEVKAWKKLRNEVAHPKIKTIDAQGSYLEKENFIYCINLFHSLILQSLSYSGPRNYYLSNGEEPNILLFNSKRIN